MSKSEKEVKIWKQFYPAAIYGSEKDELLHRANRRELVGAYYRADKEFAKGMDELMGKLNDKKSDFGSLIEKIDKLIAEAEKNLIMQKVGEAKVRKSEREKELLNLYKIFCP